MDNCQKAGCGCMEGGRRERLEPLLVTLSPPVLPPDVGPDLCRHAAPPTFDARGYAERGLDEERRLIELEDWTAPAARVATKQRKGSPTLRIYASQWLAGRALWPNTVKGYRDLIEDVIRTTRSALSRSRTRELYSLHMREQLSRSFMLAPGTPRQQPSWSTRTQPTSVTICSLIAKAEGHGSSSSQSDDPGTQPLLLSRGRLSARTVPTNPVCCRAPQGRCHGAICVDP